MINTTAIKARLTGQRVSIKDFSEALDLPEDQIERMIDGSEDLDLGQAEKIQDLLKIPNERFNFYFMNGDHDYSIKE